MTDDESLSVEEARERLADADFSELIEEYPNVNSVGIGFGERDGKRTRQVELVFYVDRKVDADELADDDLIPESLQDVPTDVIEEGSPSPEISGARGERIRPISSGVSAGGGGNGTACSVLDANGDEVLLTNRHVACDEDEDCRGETFYQPDPGQSDSEAVGTVAELGPRGSDAEENLDGAIIDLDSGFDVVGELFGAMEVGGFEEPELGELYLNCGSRTGYVSGECIAVDVTTTVDGTDYTGLARFERDPDDSWGGNSGSLHGRVDSGGVFRPVALHFAGGDESGVGHPMSDVVDEFGQLEAPAAGDQNTFTGPAVHECAIVRAYGEDGEVVIETLVANTGGGDDPQDTLTLSAGDSTATEDVDLGSMEHEIVTARLPEKYSSSEITVETSDDSQTLEIDVYVEESGGTRGSVNAVVDGAETEASDVEETVTTDGGATASRVDAIVDGEAIKVWPPSGGDYNLAPEVPDWAYNVWDEAPDSALEEWSYVDFSDDYDNRDGNLTAGINSAGNDGHVCYIGSGGEYEMETPPDSQSLVGLVGDPDDPPTVYLTMTDTAWPMGGAGTVVIEGIEFDITDTSDVALLRAGTINDYLYCRDVDLTGQRRFEVTGSGDGHKMNFLPQLSSTAEGVVERLRMPDGEDASNYHDDIDPDAYCIPFSADPQHEGDLVVKDCYVEEFLDNGYYVLNSPDGRVCLWDVEAVNNGRGGNIRVGQNDWVVGGHSEINADKSHDRPGSMFAHNANQFEEVVGLTMVAEGSDLGSGGIQTWSDAEGGLMRSCVFHYKSGGSRPIRVDSSAGVDLLMQDWYLLDNSSSSRTFGVSEQYNNPGKVTLSDSMRIDNATDNTFNIGSEGTVEAPDGTEYSDQTLDAADIGLDADLTEDDLPTFHFDYSER